MSKLVVALSALALLPLECGSKAPALSSALAGERQYAVGSGHAVFANIPRQSGSLAPALQSAEWQSLFNGKNLAGWLHLGGGRASVLDGCLVLEHDAERRPGYLLSEIKARDFDARLVCKVVTGDSGFFFRSRRHERATAEVAGPQVQLNVQPERGLGGIFELHGRAWVRKPDAALNAELLRELDWIECEITARGPRVQVKVNGRTTVDFEDPAPDNAFLAAGHFALQIHGGGHCRVLFKEISVSPTR